MYIPNILTLLRFLLILPLACALQEQNFRVALVIFIIASVSDVLDGYLARRYQLVTRIGAILDPLADKLLIFVSFGMLWLLALVPTWLLVVIISRDFLIISGAVFYHYYYGAYELEPTFISKANTFAQVFLVLLLMLREAKLLGLGAWFDTAAMVLLSLLAVISFGQYLYISLSRGWTAHHDNS